MLTNGLLQVLSPSQLTAAAVFFAFVITAVLLNAKFSFLPHDQGREFAVNGALSRGKIRGVGLINSICYLIAALLFVPVNVESIILCVLLLAVTLSGYLDDASSVPWSDYKKGLIDFIISVICVVAFIHYNSTEIYIFNTSITLPPVLYAILAIILIWVSINATNCSDGVDGLCASLSVITVLSFAFIFSSELAEYQDYSFILVGTMLAYLWFNTSPSSMLMGDAGSRALGFFIAILAMKSGHPLSYLLLSLVMIIDGCLGLAKIFLLRFLKIHILKTIRTPIHDEMRKNRGWSDTQVVFRFVIIQVLASLLFLMLKA
ncbi:MAG: phospho-N-acetylmuramoyl-pentapeptide-transferase [Eubacteriales bacterium]|nr:phospho-N-acetylmuramoyl-pentapeptide-transferase [Eubacteriales bacterium]